MVGADSSGSLPSPKVLRNSTISKKDFVYEAVTLSGHLFHGVLLSFSLNNVEPYNPLHKCRVWAVPFSLIAYSGNLIRFLFLRVLRYFSSPGYPPAIGGVSWLTPRGVTPFGHRRVIGFWLLTDDFRGLIRPSSAQHAKASVACFT